MSQESEPIAVIEGVEKGYMLDSVHVPVLQNIDLIVRPGFTVLIGPSGSGKTTLLNLIGCIDRPDKGKVTVAGTDVNALSDDALTDFRGQHIGFIFQSFNLLPVLTAYENIEYPLLLSDKPPATRETYVRRLLKAVMLPDHGTHPPGKLSGGQRQRVAIARALARRPRLVIADEPTANLDSKTSAEILALMRRLQRDNGISFLFSTHDSAVIDEADELIFLKDGVIQEERRAPPRESRRSAETQPDTTVPRP